MIEPGHTLGVEEEYHLVVPGAPSSSRTVRSLPNAPSRLGTGAHLKPEMLTSQLEAATVVCTTLEQLRTPLVGDARRGCCRGGGESARPARDEHASVRPARATSRSWPRPRYDVLLDRFGSRRARSSTSPDATSTSRCRTSTPRVRLLTLARPYLPLLAALTASSPFHAGIDTGFDSYRLAQLSLWPQGGPPPQLESGADYLATVERLVALDLVDDASAVLWELRPSARYPTLEFRIGDMCPDLLDVVLYAAVVRSLVRTLATRRAHATLLDPELRAARWQAARYGLSGRLWSPSRGEPAAAAVAMDDLLTELRPDLEEHGEWDVVAELMRRLLQQGNAATRQRAVYVATGDLRPS